MPTELTLSDVAKLAGVSPRTVRYYIAQGLLPPPTQAGPNARYTEAHLERLRIIRRLQAAHLPLADIRRRLASLPQDGRAGVAAASNVRQPMDSALDYVQSLLAGPRTAAPSLAPAASAAPLAPLPPAAAAPSSTRPPERSQWDRISLDADVELHVRRPLTRQQNKRVERLISIARQLLEEE